MTPALIRCLILACGNTTRSDDGVGPFLAEWAAERFRDNADVRVVSRQQWTPELAEEVAAADTVLFVDSSVDSGPGHVRLIPVEAKTGDSGAATHHLDAHELLGLTQGLYGSRPAHAMLLTIGIGSAEFGETFSARCRGRSSQGTGHTGKSCAAILGPLTGFAPCVPALKKAKNGDCIFRSRRLRKRRN